MCATAPIAFIFACMLILERWEFHSMLYSWLYGHGSIKYQETLMNKDQVKGKVEEVKGKVKEATGVLLDDKGMEIEGNVQKNVGKARAGLGDLKEDIKDALDD